MEKEVRMSQVVLALEEWMPHWMNEIKKDMKNEHLKSDFSFVKKYFKGVPVQKITLDELCEGYTKALKEEEQKEAIAEFLSQRWLLKHSDIYAYFEDILTTHYPDFTQINEIEPSIAKTLIEGSSTLFGAINTYIFSVWNGVAFSKEQFATLEKMAKEEEKAKKEVKKAPELSLEEALKKHEKELASLTERFERKWQGLEKKYLQDTEGLKKQIKALQKKLIA